MNTLLFQELLPALNLAVFARMGDGAFQLEGLPPAWLALLWPRVQAELGFITAADFSPFLDNFLVDAASHWQTGDSQALRSGAWIEKGTSAIETALEATALRLNGRSVLLVEKLGDRYTERTSMLQKARETVLALERLNHEIQKKQILLHCVIDDMAGQLSNLVTSLRLIDLENPTPKIRKLTRLASLAAQKQQELINRVFETFVHELDSFQTSAANGKAGVELSGIVRQVIDSYRAQAAEKGVKMLVEHLPIEASPPLKVIAEAGNLERVLGNLFRNALRHSPAGKAIVLRISAEGDDAVLVELENEGSTVPHEVRAAALDAFSESKDIGADALELHYCRIVVENWGGQLGCSPCDPAGSRFWFRLSRTPEFSRSSSQSSKA